MLDQPFFVAERNIYCGWGRCWREGSGCWFCEGEPGSEGGGDEQGRLQGEIDERFGGNLHLLAAGGGVDAGAGSGAGGCTDGSAFAAAGKGANDGAEDGSAGGLFGGVLAAARTALGPGVGDDGEVTVAQVDAGEFEGEKRAAGKMCGILRVGDASEDGRALGDDDNAVANEIGGKAGVEGLIDLGGGAGEVIVHANRDDGARREGEAANDGLGRRRGCGGLRRGRRCVLRLDGRLGAG